MHVAPKNAGNLRLITPIQKVSVPGKSSCERWKMCSSHLKMWYEPDRWATEASLTLTRMHLTNLVIPASRSTLLQPHILLTNSIHLINHWQTHGERERERGRERKNKTKQRRGKKEGRNLKSIQEKWAVNIVAFFIRGGGAVISGGEGRGGLGGHGHLRDSFEGFVLQHWGKKRWESGFMGRWGGREMGWGCSEKRRKHMRKQLKYWNTWRDRSCYAIGSSATK